MILPFFIAEVVTFNNVEADFWKVSLPSMPGCWQSGVVPLLLPEWQGCEKGEQSQPDICWLRGDESAALSPQTAAAVRCEHSKALCWVIFQPAFISKAAYVRF